MILSELLFDLPRFPFGFFRCFFKYEIELAIWVGILFFHHIWNHQLSPVIYLTAWSSELSACATCRLVFIDIAIEHNKVREHTTLLLNDVDLPHTLFRVAYLSQNFAEYKHIRMKTRAYDGPSRRIH